MDSTHADDTELMREVFVVLFGFTDFVGDVISMGASVKIDHLLVGYSLSASLNSRMTVLNSRHSCAMIF